jgi:hypothetical protein
MSAESAADSFSEKLKPNTPPLIHLLDLAPLSILAMTCGAIATGLLTLESQTWLKIATAVVLVCAWSIVWHLIAATNWRAPLESWKTWRTGDPLPVLPYTEPNSPSEKASITLGFFRHWLQHEILPQHGNAILLGAFALVIAFVLSASLGAQTFLLAILFICLAQIVAILSRGDGGSNDALEQIGVVALPMLMGFSVFYPITPIIACVALGLSLVATKNARLRNIGFGVTLLVLMFMRHTLGAFVIAVLGLPHLVLPEFRSNRWWLVGAMFAAALALS